MSEERPPQTHEIIVPRTSRYAVLGAPVSEAAELWLVCHGYAQLASRFIRRFHCIDDGKRTIVAPEALSRFYVTGGSGPHSDRDKVGASWMTREARDAEIDDQVRYLDTVLDRVLEGRSRDDILVVALGFSQGAGPVCRWAARCALPPDHLVAWGAGVPLELLTGDAVRRLSRQSFTIVMGSNEPIADAGKVAAHRAQLDAAGISHRFVRYEGGHDIDSAVLARLAAGLERNRTPGSNAV